MRILLAVAMVVAAGAAQAKVPFLNATCGDGTEVHADEGGPVYINGNEASLSASNESYYEAKHEGVTISISVSPDGSADVSYTGSGGANGICQVSGGGGDECPADVSEADRANYPACN
ncbi:MAG TPA: hypothetical protein PLH75_12680 [Amaricoccus sp.]|uniref:hypothetical protein n=1 Tax=Amaricoccus sp. TaxID=1872485 RepID=UPI001DF958E0|nr:hypothetical protein [Amaricoccus sp.]MCB1402700.1 hypothetical protein [Paracoccaceae bacterium]HPG23636.1 hypothetical protein [Amaricoccus sp.]HRW16458.1 hypothetical protein [Amaricoccus sp.]